MLFESSSKIILSDLSAPGLLRKVNLIMLNYGQCGKFQYLRSKIPYIKLKSLTISER